MVGDCVVLTVACGAACSSLVDKGRHTTIYIMLLFFATGIHTANKDSDLDLDLR